MKGIAGMEKKYSIMVVLQRCVFPLLLLIYPLLLVRQGIDVSDTTYSLGYYRFMGEMDITWVLATYLANVAGAFLMKLPMGNTLLGMNLYTGLLAGAIALICYYGLSKWLPAWLAFFGEVIALSLCWCPTTILYNYLTYFFFALGCIFLCKALFEGKPFYKGKPFDKGKLFYKGSAFLQGGEVYYVCAGICLGLNVMVRFSNLAEAALIVVVWFAGWLERDKFSAVMKRTGLCLAGYLAGFGSILLVIMAKYGAGAFGDMIASLFGMTGEASDYTLAGMVLATASAYWAAFKWMAYMIPCIGAGMVLFAIGKGKMERAKKVLYCLGILILLRFYLGRGMFSLRYYNEGCIFQWMMLFLILSVMCCAAGIGGFLSKDRKERILAAMVLVVILITPLGSNNYTYQNMNNLFFVAPYTLWACWRIWKRTENKILHFPWRAFMAAILLMTLVQGIGFGCTYVFRDGIYGEKRVCKVENSPVLKNMTTTQENGESLQGLIDFCQENGVGSEPLLLWGDAPGLSYILDAPSAIFTTWPEIPSNTYDQLEQALMDLDWKPDIILHNEPGKDIVAGEKTDLILDYISEGDYTCIFENRCYRVFRAL